MRIVRAKHGDNKLGVRDNRPFSIVQIELLLERGFKVKLLDLQTGIVELVSYDSRDMFDEDWELIAGIEYSRKNYEISKDRYW